MNRDFWRRYHEYMNSYEWAQLKIQYRRSGAPLCCFVCKQKTPNIDFHHLTYARLGSERLSDIAPCCQQCHDLIHTCHRTQTGPKKLNIKQVSEFVRDHYEPTYEEKMNDFLAECTARRKQRG